MPVENNYYNAVDGLLCKGDQLLLCPPARTEVTIPTSVTSIGAFAFDHCESLISIHVASGHTAFTEVAGCLCEAPAGDGDAKPKFLRCPPGAQGMFHFPDLSLSVDPVAFRGCSGITSITFPANVDLGDEYYNYFADCAKLQSFQVDAGNPNLFCSNGLLFGRNEPSDYQKDTALVACPAGYQGALTLPGDFDFDYAYIYDNWSPTHQGYGPFTNCSGLTELTLQYISNFYGYDDFFTGCSRLKKFHFNPNAVGADPADGATERNGVLYIGEKGDYYTLVAYPPARTGDFTVPDGIQYIGRNAFRGRAVRNVTIPATVQYIWQDAFRNCPNLTRVEIAPMAEADSDEYNTGLYSISQGAFGDCPKLSYIYIPETLGSIGFSGSNVFFGSPNVAIYGVAGSMAQEYAGKYDIPFNAVSLPSRPAGDPSTGDIKIPVHSTDSTDVLDAALKQADLANLFEDVTCDMGVLRGPKISIAGEEFYLFEYASKLELPFKKLPIEASVDNEKKTVNVLIGFKEVKGDMTIVGDPDSPADSRNDFWKSYTDAKNLYKTIGGKSVTSAKFRGKFQDVYDELQDLGMDLVVGATGKVCGYAEFSFESGKLEFSEGGGILSVSVNATQSARIPSFPAAYVTLRFGVSTEGKLRIVSDVDNWVFDPTFDAALTTAIGVGLGKNNGQFQAYVEGGFDGELGAHIRPMWVVTREDPFSVDMTGNLYFSWKAKALLLEHGDTYKKQLVKLGLYPRLELLSDQDSGPLSMEDLLASARPVTRDYLNAPSLMAVTDDYSFSKIEYPYAEPTLLRLQDNRLLMAWVGDDGQKADADRTSIFYSIYDNRTWSTPAVIHESGTYADHPVLYQDGGNVYAVWMQADTQLGSMEAQEAFRHLDLMFSAFDGDTWSRPRMISGGNALAKTDYALAAKDGTIAVAWVENSDNDMFMGSGTNTIYLKTCTDGNWGAISTVYESANPVTGVDVDLNAGLQVSWSVSSGKTATAYVWDESGNLQSSAGGDRDAYWAGGSRYELRGTELYRDGAATGLSGLSNFEIVSSGAQTAVLTLVPTGFTCELYGSYYDAGSGTWGPLVQLTRLNQYLRSYSAVLDESGKLVAALNLVNVDADAEQVYDNTTAQLVVVDDCQYSDLVVEDWISYDNSLVTPGGTLPLSFQVTNNSLETLTSVTASANGQSQTVSCLLPAGESAVLTMNYVLPSSLSEQEVRLTVTPGYTKEESNTANNTASVRIGMADLETVIAAPESNTAGASVNIQVKNKGYTAAENVLLKVYRSNSGGEVLCEQNLGQIMAGKSAAYTFQLPDELLFVDDPETMNALSCEVTSDTEERMLANNADRVAFGNLLPMQVSAAAGADSVQFSVSLEGGETGFSDSMIVLALYDAKDKMLSVRSETVSVSPGGNKTVTFTIDRGQDLNAARAKVFWADRQNTPITRAWTGSYPAGT